MAIAYRAGTRAEGPGEHGAAHFLEHMMFKGSERFAPGEIDRLTQALGGSNNAYTSHDLALYYFTFAADRWRAALDIEADRMRGLRLDADEVDAERRVIVEEIAMYEGEPWDALDEAVSARFFAGHAYGRPVLGTRASLAAIDGAVLDAFHRRWYRPSNAVLLIVGDVDQSAAHEAAAGAFGGLAEDEVRPAEVSPGTMPRAGIERVERRQGEVARLLVAVEAPSLGDPDHAALRLLSGVLAAGRASRLHRALVDDGQLCTWVSADLGESLDAGSLAIAAEAVPGADAARIEANVLDALRTLVETPPSDEEIARARQLLLADWLFGHERADQGAFLLGTALSLADLEHPRRQLDGLLAASRDDLARVATRCFDLERRLTVGWSLPARRPATA